MNKKISGLFLVAFIIIILGISVLPSQAQQAPTLTNGNFESCITNTAVPPGWSTNQTSLVGCTPLEPYTGSWRAYAVQSAYLYQSLQLTAGTTYTFSAYAKNFSSASPVANNSRLIISSIIGGGGIVYCSNNTTSLNWTLLSCNYTPANNVSVYFNLIGGFNDPGSRFDDASITASGGSAPDTTAPVISSVAASGITSSAATITWLTNEPANGQVEYGPVGGATPYPFSTSINTSLITSHSFNLTGLISATTYNYRVKSRDAAGNLQSSSNFTFTTQAGSGDTTPPTRSNGQPTGTLPAGTTSATLSLATNENATCKYSNTPNTPYGSMINTFTITGGTTHSRGLTGLQNGQTYNYYVRCQDQAGNMNPTDYLISFMVVSPSSDTTAPIISSVVASGITSSGATITWMTNELSDSQIYYGTTASYGSQTALNSTLLTSHAQSLSGLQPSTLYHYQTRSRDAAGNQGASGDFTFTTLAGSSGPVIDITQTSVTSPIVLDQMGKTYRLVNNLNCTKSCFVVTANDVTLDLNGKTATFGMDAGLYRYGVAIPPDYVPNLNPFDPLDIPSSLFRGADRTIIKNGSLIQGAAGAENMIIFAHEGARLQEVANITGLYQGTDSQGIVAINGGNLNIHDNVIQAALTRITNRHNAKAAISINGGRGNIYVRNNLVYGDGQFGIKVSSKKAIPVTDLEISGNTMRINGITTNPYQLVVFGFSKRQQGITPLIFNNRIESPGNVSNRGLILEGIDSSADGIDGAKIYNNYIDVKEHGNVEYGEAGWTHALRMREPDYPIPEAKFFNNEFYGNTFKSTGYYNSATDNGDGVSIRTSFYSLAPAGELPNVFHDNTIISETLNSSVEALAIYIEGNNEALGTVFRNNVISSNNKLIKFHFVGGGGLIFDGNTFSKGMNPVNFKTLYYNNVGNSTGVVFQDSTFGSGVDLLNMYQWPGSPPAEPRGDRNFYVKWSLDLSVKNNLGQAVGGAQVDIRDKNNVLVFTGSTDGGGKVLAPLSEYFWRQAPTYPTPPPTTTTYNPYSVTVLKSGQSQTQAVTMDARKTITMLLNVAGSSDFIPPVVSMTAPTPGSTVSGSVNVSANATDNVAVAGVQFKLDGINLGIEDTTFPYSIIWNTTQTTNGNHVLTATARDTSGITATSPNVSVTVNNAGSGDTTSPTALITAPAAGATLNGTVTVSANASDNVAVVGVQFKLDDVINLGAEDTTFPYSIPWDTTQTTNSSHALTATARDAAGNTGISPYVSVAVNNAGAPSTKFVINDRVRANTNNLNIRLTPNGTFLGQQSLGSLGTVTGGPTFAGSFWWWNINFDIGSDGWAAEDFLDKYTSAPTDTTSPSVSITSPTSGATLNGTVTVSANASDVGASGPSSGVAGVQFKLGGVNLGAEDTTSPYSITWNTTGSSNGSHTLTAVARDVAGNISNSSAILVTVANGGAGPAPTSSLNLVFVVSPKTGTAPLNNISLTASVSGLPGPYTYTFYCNRVDSGTNILPGHIFSVSTFLSSQSTQCSYASAGTYTPKVIVQKNGTAVEARDGVNVSAQSSGPQTPGPTGGGGTPSGGGGDIPPAPGPTGPSGTTPTTTSTPKYANLPVFKLTKPLYPRINDAQVKSLQQMLNYLGISVSPTGPGSFGNETIYYGLKTKTAVAKYQVQKGIVPSLTDSSAGLVGPKTRKALNDSYEKLRIDSAAGAQVPGLPSDPAALQALLNTLLQQVQMLTEQLNRLPRN